MERCFLSVLHRDHKKNAVTGFLFANPVLQKTSARETGDAGALAGLLGISVGYPVVH